MPALKIGVRLAQQGLLRCRPHGECGAAAGALVAGEDEGCSLFLDLLAIILQLAVPPGHAAAEKSIAPLPGARDAAAKSSASDFATLNDLKLHTQQPNLEDMTRHGIEKVGLFGQGFLRRNGRGHEA